MRNTSPVAPGRGTTWRPRAKRERLQPLPSDCFPGGLTLYNLGDSMNGTVVLGGAAVPGEQRCSAIGLLRGPCRMHHVAGSRYCYYHDKLQRGLTEPDEHSSSYPVWPLPATGYVLLEEAA